MRGPKLLLYSLLLFTTSALAQQSSSTATNTRQTTATSTSTNNNNDSTSTSAGTSTATGTTASSTASSSSAVTITASNSQTSDSAITASLSQGYVTPTVTPPPTNGAPYMQAAKYPEGTIFIAVGAGLAFCTLIVFIWRGIVAWSLHRSMQRATSKSSYTDSKSALHMMGGGGGGKGGSGGAFYAVGPGSALSLDHLNTSNRSPGGPGPNGSLFFSPTSNNVAPPSTGGGSGDRRSTYLPAGFYAAGNRNSGVLPNNSSQTRFSRARGPGVSPPGTPLMAPQSRGGGSSIGTERMSSMRINDSQTSLALPPTGRAPSAYLEDLFENHQLSDQPSHSQGGRF